MSLFRRKTPTQIRGRLRVKEIRKALKVLFSYCRDYRLILIIAIICSAASSVLAAIGPHYISDLVATISAGVLSTGINIDMTRITILGFILVSIYLSNLILDYIQILIMTRISCMVTMKMRSDLAAKINRLPLLYFDTHNQGDTLSIVINDVDTIGLSLNMSIGTLATASVTLIASIIMMLVTEWRLAFTAMIPSIVGFLIVTIIMHTSQEYFFAKQKTLATVNGHIEEYYTGQSIIRAYNTEEKAYKMFKNSNEKLKKETFKAECLSSLLKPIMNLTGNLAYAAVCIVGAYLAFSGEINFALVVAFMIYVRLFTNPLSQLGQGFSNIQSALGASEHIEGFLKEEEFANESDKTTTIDDVKGEVTFDHISFGYTPNKIVINDFSFKVEPGQKVAIVGPTGAGKSTLVNLLMRFYEVNSGKILIDGISLADLKRENVRKMFAMVLQETWLFKGTIRENLLYGKDNISDEKLLEICDKCGLKTYIDSLPDGLDSNIRDSASIAAGIKQLLTIARAMLLNAPLLILDEATPSVDTRTEARIQEAMDALAKGKTSFVIAHRLSTIKDADVIIYMQDGDIKETGTHQELMDKNGLYADLYNSQFNSLS